MPPTTETKRPSATAAAGDGADGAKKGFNKLVLIAIVAVVMLALGGVGYFVFLKGPSTPPPPKPGAMVQMDAQTLTLTEGHFLKVQIAIQLVDGAAAPETFVTVQAAQLIIDTFSNLSVDELTTNAARKDLTATLLKGLKKDYPGEVYDVFLTQFVIQ
jgi:flagellar FliL protein